MVFVAHRKEKSRVRSALHVFAVEFDWVPLEMSVVGRDLVPLVRCQPGTSLRSEVSRRWERLQLNKNYDNEVLEAAIWAASGGSASVEQLELIDANKPASIRLVNDLMAETKTALDSVQGLTGPERTQVIADFANELAGLRRVHARLLGRDEAAVDDDGTTIDRWTMTTSSGRVVRLQASWSDGVVVSGRRERRPRRDDEGWRRLEALVELRSLGGHRGVPLPAVSSEAVSIPVAEAMGWLSPLAKRNEQ